jgi:hypothetical protein
MKQDHPQAAAGSRTPVFAALALAAAMVALPAAAAAQVSPAPTEKDWLALSKLPDWSGVWVPNIADQFAQRRTNVPPWTPAVAPQIDFQEKEFAAGRPFLILKGCLPQGMPSLMLITHNALEFLMTPGRVTILGESDGNRLRRIYTDGRKHPDDPDLTLHGHSIGHWEGDTLVVDTVGIMPEAWIATDEAIGNPNNGDMHIVERIHQTGPDRLVDEMEITAPKVLTRPWKTTRIFNRERDHKFDIVEGECVQGNFTSGKDKYGNAVLNEIPVAADGSVVPRNQ